MPGFDPVQLVRAAVAARQNAYAPYSHFAVGAALLAEDGTVFTGCNVENAAYGVSNCAERTALFKAVSEGHRTFAAIAVAGAAAGSNYTGPQPRCSPCGVCRQALFEFGGKDLFVVLATGGDGYEMHTLGELLPLGFGPHNLA
ncbi:cytidine deaminase [Clostridia bacterium OttesenSCG-928-O13]|nr:cytidine deaminase [Clostridia bacterium OttesenSCG-928-O13]